MYSVALSSGTSARPKEAMRSVNSMFSALSIMNDDLGVGDDDRILVLAPQTGGTGYSYSVAFPMITGARADVTELPVGDELVARIRELRPSVLVAVPTRWRACSSAAGGDAAMCSDRLIVSTTSTPLLGDVAARRGEECGCPIVSVYGATDGLVPVMSAPGEPPAVRHGSVGRLIAGRDADRRRRGQRPPRG
ncbi:MAG: AMP-binding protein [Acidimicrobiia bacterium]